MYECWMAILHQFDCDIKWKSASDMVVADSLLRTQIFSDQIFRSPAEDHDFFPYVPEKPSAVNPFPHIDAF